MIRAVAPNVSPPSAGPWLAAPDLKPLEIAYGLAFGFDDTRPDRPTHIGRVADELDNVMRPALERSPCLVSFSGGRDSSALLAWAADLARREGHELPIPATLVIPGDSDADETEWQELVLDHVGISERVVITVGDELDCVGPVASGALRRHGLLWPFNTHMHIPIYAAAAGGSVITGFGGDELGRSSEYNWAAQALAHTRPLKPADALTVGFALSPPLVRRSVMRRRTAKTLAELTWLRTDARRELAREIARVDAAVPVSWAKVLTDFWPRQRYVSRVTQSMGVAASPWDVQVRHPFADSRVLAAFASLGGFGGLGSRGNLLNAVFGDLLPQKVLFRHSKATFSNVLITEHTREFLKNWTGAGVDTSLVDPEALAAHWRSDAIDMRSVTQLQKAWLADNPRSAPT
jgi:asparagine synthase (glutamine-hydrolysing)